MNVAQKFRNTGYLNLSIARNTKLILLKPAHRTKCNKKDNKMHL